MKPGSNASSPRRWSLAAGLVWLMALGAPSHAAVLHARTVHLRSGDQPEWEQFATRTPDGPRLDLTFNAPRNDTEATLFIRQDEVRQDWNVELNGKRIGRLFTMEADLVHTIGVPAGALKEGENKLSIVPPKANDDILIHEVVLELKPSREATAEGTLAVRVTEKGAPVPSRITIVDSRGALAALVAITNAAPGRLAARPGVVYGDGTANIGLRVGTYTVYASRGFEYSVATQTVRIAKGESRTLALSLTREVETRGLVGCDTHVHTVTHSGHGDCHLDERMFTLAGEGIELPIATDHNTNINYDLPAERTGMRRWFTPVAGNEVTTPAGHFNIFPVAAGAPVPDYKLMDWTKLDAALRATPGVRVVVLNHPRNVHNNFQPFAATNFNAVSGENKRGPDFQFDAMELLNSSAQQSDYMLVYRDWFALLNYGYRVTGVGSSDSHDVSRYIVGQGRTYIETDDADTARIDVAAACSNLLAGRALVSMGLLARMTVNDRFRVGDLVTNVGDQLRVSVNVAAPSWSSATRVELFANGVRVRERAPGILPGQSAVTSKGSGLTGAATRQDAGGTFGVEWVLPRPAHDVYLIVIATGPGVDAAFWATPKPYQPTSPGWTNRVVAVTNPIWVDADGDGRFMPARGYAKHLVEKHGRELARLLRALADFDEAVAAQAASLCSTPIEAHVLRGAAPHVRRGFEAYATGHW